MADLQSTKLQNKRYNGYSTEKNLYFFPSQHHPSHYEAFGLSGSMGMSGRVGLLHVADSEIEISFFYNLLLLLLCHICFISISTILEKVNGSDLI